MELIKINRKNKNECLKLKTGGHVASNERSLKDARRLFFISSQYLIYDGSQPAGYMLFLRLKSKILRRIWRRLFPQIKNVDLSKKTVYLMRFMIDQSIQSKGLGSKALDISMKEFAQKGYDIMMLSTSPENERGIAFYKKNGFILTSDIMAGEVVLYREIRGDAYES